jgi:hypothetical protein
MDQTLVQVVLGYVMAFVLEKMKKVSWFSVLTENSTHYVKVAWAWIVAAASAIAVAFSFDSTLGRLTIDGLTWANVKGGLAAFVVSLIAQKITYRVAIAPKVPTGG